MYPLLKRKTQYKCSIELYSLYFSTTKPLFLRVSKISFLEKNPENVDDSISDLLAFIDMELPLELQKRIFNLIYNSYTEPSFVEEFSVVSATERSGLVTSRVGQGAYRKSIL